MWTCDLGFPVFGSPLVLPGRPRLVVATVEGALLSLDTRTGSLVSRLPAPGPVFGSPVMLEDDSIVLGCQDGSVIRAQDSEDRLKVVWRTEAGAGLVASPDILACGRVLVCCTTRGEIKFIGKDKGNIIYSSDSFPGEIFSSPLTFEVN